MECLFLLLLHYGCLYLTVEVASVPVVLVLHSSVSNHSSNYSFISGGLQLVFHDLGTSSCDEEEATAVGIFAHEIFEKEIGAVAVVGPSCTDSAYAISRLIGRGALPMIHLHTSPMPEQLAAQVEEKSFGLLGPVDLLADASIALMQHANWTRVVTLYQDNNNEINYIFQRIQSEVNSNDILMNSSLIYEGGIYNHLKSSLTKHATRIMFLLMDIELTRKVLCAGFHLKAVYPVYQWVILRTELRDILPEQNIMINHLSCSRHDLASVLVKALAINFHSEVSGNDTISSCINEHADLKLALYQCGILAANMVWNSTGYDINAIDVGFAEGTDIAGSILYNHKRKIAISQFNSVSNQVVVNSTVPMIRKILSEPNNLTMISSKIIPLIEVVSLPLATIFLAIATVILTIVVVLHALTVYFRKSKSVKAHSIVLLSLSYLGAYFIFTVMYIYFVQKSFEITSDFMYENLCRSFLLFGGIGLTLLFGTVLVKTWRLYQIFVHYMNPAKYLSNSSLIVMVLGLTSVDFIICTFWFTIDPIKRQYNELSTDYILGKVKTQAVCESKSYFFLLLLLFCFQVELLFIAMWFIYLLRKHIPKTHRNFQSTSVLKLVYITLFIVALGLPMYYLAHYILRNLYFEFIMIGVLFFGILTAFIFMLFLPPLAPVLNKLLHQRHRLMLKRLF